MAQDSIGWKLTPITCDSVNIILEVKIDPGGSIPVWLINLSVNRGPYNTIIGMIKQLNSNKNIKLNYITESDDCNSLQMSR